MAEVKHSHSPVQARAQFHGVAQAILECRDRLDDETQNVLQQQGQRLGLDAGDITCIIDDVLSSPQLSEKFKNLIE